MILKKHTIPIIIGIEILAVILSIVALSYATSTDNNVSCDVNVTNVNPVNESRVSENLHTITTEYYDSDQKLIQRVDFHKSYKITIITDYYWQKDAWGHSYIGSSIISIDRYGKIISSTQDRNLEEMNGK